MKECLQLKKMILSDKENYMNSAHNAMYGAFSAFQ